MSVERPYRLSVLAFTAVILLTGCSWSQVFRLSLTVVDKTDGKSIPGAKVVVDASEINEERKNDPVPQDTENQTNEMGRLGYEFSISGYTPTNSGGRRWYLKVRKEGYEPVVIDIKPDPPPPRNRDRQPIPLTAKVEMQRVAELPR